MQTTLLDWGARALSNDFFAGGLALGLLGLVAAAVRSAWSAALRTLARRFSVSVTIDNRSPAFWHLHLWLEESGALAHARRVRVSDLSRSEAQHPLYAPAPGRHWFFQDGQFAWLIREISEKTRVEGNRGTRPMETVTLTLPFGRVETVRAWIDAGAAVAERARQKAPGLFVFQQDYWESFGALTRRSLDTVLSEDDRVERLLADLRWFYGAQDWYADRGVPWRRGYLLHGPPGTGKSTAIRALASELGLDIALLDLGQAGLTDDQLREGLACAPARSLVALEDVDAVFKGRSDAARTGVSFSGLLNAIDGIAAQEGRALFMTTNHPERLDPALIRPGRADVHVELGPVGAEAARRLYLRFFPGETARADRFAGAIGTAQVVPAALQGWLLANCADPEAAAGAGGLASLSPPVETGRVATEPAAVGV
ncbi:MAG: AAA family ATPase [Pseudomonadota bacterium]